MYSTFGGGGGTRFCFNRHRAVAIKIFVSSKIFLTRVLETPPPFRLARRTLIRLSTSVEISENYRDGKRDAFVFNRSSSKIKIEQRWKINAPI